MERKRGASARHRICYLITIYNLTPTVHSVPGETFGPLLLRDQTVAVDVAGAREHFGALLRLHGLLGQPLQVSEIAKS